MKKHILIVGAVLLLALSAQAQDYKFAPMDKSPVDIVYYPVNAPKSKNPHIDPLIRVIYSRPQKNGREIFGVLEQFGNVWRTGANESTEIKFYKPIVLGNTKIKAGTYSLFTIPEKESWTIIINKNTDRWGAFTYDQSQDIVRLTVPVTHVSKTIEALSITFKGTEGEPVMVIGWDQTVVEVPFTVK